MERSNQSALNCNGAEVGTVTVSAIPDLNVQVPVLNCNTGTTCSGLSTKVRGDQQTVVRDPATDTTPSRFAYVRDCRANQTAAVRCCTITLTQQSVLLASQPYWAWVH